MRRNMQLVFERWGRWAASEEYCSLVDWPAMSVAPQQLPQASGKPSCTDEDGLTLDTCIAHMSTVFPQASLLVMLGIRLEMDPEVVEPEPVACTQKPMLIF